MNSTYYLLLIIFLTTLIIRTVYELLKRDGKVDPGNKMLFWLVFADMVLLWTS